MDTKLTGAYGEVIAARYLRDHGYTILDANYRTRLGEIDIVAANRKYIVFVEVKTRSEGSLIDAALAVDYQKQQRISATAQSYISANRVKLQPRFDVAEVYVNGLEVKDFNYIENAY